MKLIIGLGNPGEKYELNRHNVGHLFVDFLSEKVSMEGKDIKFFKTDCFMNDSGKCVLEKVNFYKVSIDSLILVHDDLDLRFGEFKIQLGVGPKIHYGVNSVEEALGNKDFWRVRIGVDAREGEFRIPGEKYVLEDFSKEEVEKLEMVFPKIWEELAGFLN